MVVTGRVLLIWILVHPLVCLLDTQNIHMLQFVSHAVDAMKVTAVTRHPSPLLESR